MIKFYRKPVALSDFWVSSNDRLSDFDASSWQRGDSPVPLLVVRVVLASLALAILVWAVSSAPTPYWLIYLTNWGLLLNVLMTLAALLVSVMTICKKPSAGNLCYRRLAVFHDDYGAEMPWYMSTYWILHNVAICLALTITALYWILLYDPVVYEIDRELFLLDVATHGVNSCIAVTELLAARTPVRAAHMYQPLGVGLWYVIFSGIYYAAGGTDINGEPVIYEILDWRVPGRTGIVVGGSLVGLVVIYMVVYGMALCRDKLTDALLRTTSMDLPLAPPDRHDPDIV